MRKSFSVLSVLITLKLPTKACSGILSRATKTILGTGIPSFSTHQKHHIHQRQKINKTFTTKFPTLFFSKDMLESRTGLMCLATYEYYISGLKIKIHLYIYFGSSFTITKKCRILRI